MQFKFESAEFKNTFAQVLELTNKREDPKLELPEQVVKIASAFHSVECFFRIETDLSLLDEHINYSRTQDRFNFINFIKEKLDNYQETKSLNDYIAVVFQSSALIYIYLREYEFNVGGFNNNSAFEVGDFLVTIGLELKNSEYWRLIDFGDRDLPFNILKKIFYSNDIRNLNELISFKNDLTDQLKEMDSKIQQYEVAFEQKKETIIELEQKLDKYKITYDFVLLNKGFQQLYEQKREELEKVKDTYSIVAATMFFIPFIEFAFLVFGFFYFNGNIPSAMWLILIPFLTLILITLYLVKISLQDKRSIQSQMMQLELRIALCQFIHNYADDSEKLHKKNSEGFEKFENIIFSPLVSSDDKIPTTFDGMEQLAKLVSEFRK